MRTRTAFLAAALALAGTGTAALALDNPLVAHLKPVGSAGIAGTVTFFKLGNDVNVGVQLSKDLGGSQAADIRKGTCSSYAGGAHWPLVPVEGTTQDTRLSGVGLAQLVGNVILVHKTKDDNSPVISCAPISG